jgi:hypothetical protein
MRDNYRDTIRGKVIKPLRDSLEAEKKAALDAYLFSLLPTDFPKDSPFAFRPEAIDINLYVTADGAYDRIGYMRVANEKRFPVSCKGTNYHSNGFDIDVSVDTGWGQTFVALYRREEELSDRESALNSELHRLFVSCSTTKQLVETYPDIEQYIVIDEEKALPVPQNFAKLTSLLRG